MHMAVGLFEFKTSFGVMAVRVDATSL